MPSATRTMWAAAFPIPRARAQRSEAGSLTVPSTAAPPPAASELAPHERATLEIGLVVVAAALGLGMELGHWPVWTAAAMTAGYVAWILVYSEATVRAIKRREAASAAA